MAAGPGGPAARARSRRHPFMTRKGQPRPCWGSCAVRGRAISLRPPARPLQQADSNAPGRPARAAGEHLGIMHGGVGYGPVVLHAIRSDDRVRLAGALAMASGRAMIGVLVRPALLRPRPDAPRRPRISNARAHSRRAGLAQVASAGARQRRRRAAVLGLPRGFQDASSSAAPSRGGQPRRAFAGSRPRLLHGLIEPSGIMRVTGPNSTISASRGLLSVQSIVSPILSPRACDGSPAKPFT